MAPEAELCTKLSDVKLTDKEAKRNEWHFSYFGLLDPLIKAVLRDERDMPLVYLQLNITNVLMPSAFACFYYQNHWVGALHLFLLVIGFFERFILMLHFSSHKHIYKVGILNQYALYILCPMFGIPPGIYYLHHVIMHHAENNHGKDVSETESYQRDRLSSFCVYWLRFSIGLFVELPLYAVKTKRWDWFVNCTGMMGVWMGGVYFLWTNVSWMGTLYVFVIPYLFGITAMSFGNYAQHIFVDPQDASNNYRLSYNCFNTPVNQTTFNDGYHILHHIYPRLHWTELPTKFEETLAEHKKQGALTFKGVHFFDVGLYVMSGNLEALVRNHYVHLDCDGSKPPTVKEMTAELQRRMEYIPPYESTRKRQ